MFTVETIDPSDKEYQLIHGHCNHRERGQPRCTNWATVRLIDHDGQLVPASKMCNVCAQEIIDEYHQKLDIHWSIKPIVIYRVHGQRDGTEQVIWGTFYSRDHAQAYADKLNEVKG